MPRHALIFANGDVHDGPMVRRALDNAVNPLVVAADGGARVAQFFGLRVETVIGDMDSLTTQELEVLTSAGAQVRRHPEDKDATDLELALYHARKVDADWIRIIGGVGDRLDQTLANVYLLGLPVLADCDVSLVAGKQETRLLHPGEHHIEGAVGDTVSLIPVGGAVNGIRTENLQYPLTDETLDFGPARGISNVLQAEAARITTRQGMLLLIHTTGKA
jgi:thiamine pyrophosphokinase